MSDKEEMIDVPVKLDKATTAKLNKMTRKELMLAGKLGLKQLEYCLL